MCQDGAFITDNISFYSDAKVGTELTAEADWKRRGLYIGPQVSHSLLSFYLFKSPLHRIHMDVLHDIV